MEKEKVFRKLKTEELLKLENNQIVSMLYLAYNKFKYWYLIEPNHIFLSSKILCRLRAEAYIDFKYNVLFGLTIIELNPDDDCFVALIEEI